MTGRIKLSIRRSDAPCPIPAAATGATDRFASTVSKALWSSIPTLSKAKW